MFRTPCSLLHSKSKTLIYEVDVSPTGRTHISGNLSSALQSRETHQCYLLLTMSWNDYISHYLLSEGKCYAGALGNSSDYKIFAAQGDHAGLAISDRSIGQVPPLSRRAGRRRSLKTSSQRSSLTRLLSELSRL